MPQHTPIDRVVHTGGGNVLFNDALNTFYLRLYSEKGNLLPPHGLLFPIRSNGSFICIIPDRITHTTPFVTPVVEHWPERQIAQWVQPMKDRSDDPSHHELTLLPRSYISPSTYRGILLHQLKLTERLFQTPPTPNNRV